jgi:hypothetical protein
LVLLQNAQPESALSSERGVLLPDLRQAIACYLRDLGGSLLTLLASQLVSKFMSQNAVTRCIPHY